MREWHIDDGRWETRKPRGKPDALAMFAGYGGTSYLLYDPNRERLMLFLGIGGGLPFPKRIAVLEWSDATEEWITRYQPPPEPAPDDPWLYGFSVVYSSGKFLLMGPGLEGNEPTKNIAVWEWDGDWDGQGRWSRRRSLNPKNAPPSRGAAAFAYDDTSKKIIMFGGSTNVGIVSETWEYDGIGWTEKKESRDPDARWPPERTSASMAYDPSRRGVILFGGMDDKGVGLNDAWLWDANMETWREVTSTPRLKGISSAFLVRMARTIALVGGISGGGPQSDMWELK